MSRLLLLLLLISCGNNQAGNIKNSIFDQFGALIQSDTTEQTIYLCFTGHDFNDGFDHVLEVLKENAIKGSFFLTGDFIRVNGEITKKIKQEGHYIGAHSDKHLLYCDWNKRDSLLHTVDSIKMDISQNLEELYKLNINPETFMPPYEWYNLSVVNAAADLNQQVINFTPGTRSHADYTTPDLKHYISSRDILESIYNFEDRNGMNGFHLLIHPGVSPLRTDKFYLHLDDLIVKLREKGYSYARF